MSYALTRSLNQAISVSLPPPVGVLSLSMWVKPASAPGSFPNRHGLVSRFAFSLQEGYYAHLSNWDLQAGFYNGSTYIQASGATGGGVGTWLHVGIVWDWSTTTAIIKVLANGTQVGTASGSRGTPADHTDNQTLGALKPSVGEYWDGDFAEAAIWDRELTAHEWAALARGVSADQIAPSSCVRYWPLIRTLREIKSGSTVSLYGAPTVSAHRRMFY